MIINSQGFGHFTNEINNQDFGIELSRMLLILDGCSGAKYSEVGTKLFAQLFSRKEECDKLERFEYNVKQVFDEIINMMSKYYESAKELEEKFIMENLLFTIIACFELDDKYVVKLFGDGYIITKNKMGCISYMKHSYGKCPPYFAYKYCDLNYQNYNFKTIEFDKKTFPVVGIASDGIFPFVKDDKSKVDYLISNKKELLIRNYIFSNRQMFFDDVTIALFDS